MPAAPGLVVVFLEIPLMALSSSSVSPAPLFEQPLLMGFLERLSVPCFLPVSPLSLASVTICDSLIHLFSRENDSIHP